MYVMHSIKEHLKINKYINRKDYPYRSTWSKAYNKDRNSSIYWSRLRKISFCSQKREKKQQTKPKTIFVFFSIS